MDTIEVILIIIVLILIVLVARDKGMLANMSAQTTASATESLTEIERKKLCALTGACPKK